MLPRRTSTSPFGKFRFPCDLIIAIHGPNLNRSPDLTICSFCKRGFARRGGETDKHEHGWGLAIYEGRGLRTFHDPLPAAKSRVAEFVAQYPMKTLNMMAHIRYATQGTVSLENVHPFQREMVSASLLYVFLLAFSDRPIDITFLVFVLLVGHSVVLCT